MLAYVGQMFGQEAALGCFRAALPLVCAGNARSSGNHTAAASAVAQSANGQCRYSLLWLRDSFPRYPVDLQDHIRAITACALSTHFLHIQTNLQTNRSLITALHPQRALRRWRVLWRRKPFSVELRMKLPGKCGRLAVSAS